VNTEERWQRVSRILSEALDLPESDRGRFLAEVVRQEPALRTEVFALLDEMSQGEPFLEPRTSPEAEPEPIDDIAFGPYRVVGGLGEGGMGVVYLAERSDGQFTRQVAIKRVGRAAPGTDVRRRFRDEREILAGLDHPNIARLLDAGVDAKGVPYLVMEHVQGVRLTSYCADRQLGVRERLSLFLKVCAAVQHAHQHLVIHRDLKPGNILVTPEGEPKLLDFGIAKLLARAPGDATRTVNQALTLDYASPEQVRGDDVTTASDVYSLGVILYELLAEEKPYEVASQSLADAVRIVCEKAPSLPSLKAPAVRRKELAGDLDCITGKALEKAPADRYESVSELAREISAYLDHRPVKARRPSFAYVGWKFVRRHRTGVAVSVAVMLSLVASLGIAVRQARRADMERRRAEARFEDVRRLAGSVLYELHDSIATLPGATPARQILVTRALEYLDRLAGEGSGDLALQRELADAYQRVAQVQGGGVGANLGDTKGAMASFGKALAIRQDLAARNPADPQDTLALAVLDFELAAMQRAQGQASRAEESYLSVASRLDSLLKEGVLPDSQRRRVGAAYQRLAEVQAFQGKHAAALKSAERAAIESEAAWQALPGDALTRSTLAASLYQLGDALADESRYPEALVQVRRGRSLLEPKGPGEALDAQQTRILLYLLHGESTYLGQMGDGTAALRVQERAVAVAKEALRRDPRDRWSQMAVAIASKRLGNALFQAGDTAGSVRHFRQALEITRRAVAEDPQYSAARMEVASAEASLGHALLSQGRPETIAEACASLDRVKAFWTELRAKGELPPGETAELERLPAWGARCRSPH
jgi:tetratricopeptide (TPR) repeat protein